VEREAARKGDLLADFKGLILVNKYKGGTVARDPARKGDLPTDFKNLAMAKRDG
jgi:hypothetical protein